MSSQFKVDCGMRERSASPELFLICGLFSVPLQIPLKNAGFFLKCNKVTKHDIL